MALSEEEIRSIGKVTGKKTVVHARCKERAFHVLGEIDMIDFRLTDAMNTSGDPDDPGKSLRDLANELDRWLEEIPSKPPGALRNLEEEAVKSWKAKLLAGANNQEELIAKGVDLEENQWIPNSPSLSSSAQSVIVPIPWPASPAKARKTFPKGQLLTSGSLAGIFKNLQEMFSVHLFAPACYRFVVLA